MPRPIRIAMLGAGSMFTPRLVNDVLGIPGNAGGHIALCDIDQERLSTMHDLITRLIDKLGAKNWTLCADTDHREAIPGCDYIINCIEVSGVECVRADNDIPARYGVDQCIGDTIGPGGLFKGLRTIPTWLGILADAQRLCPDALVLNYTNPMSMMCLAAARSSSMRVVGLCHSVQGTSRQLATRAGVALEEMRWACAGINHLAWFTRLEHAGTDLYPRLMESARADLRGEPASDADAGDLVRKDMMLHFGAFITESSGHLSEYLPYYRKRADLVQRYCRHAYDGESGFYAKNWPLWRQWADHSRAAMLSGQEPLGWERSWEYASQIIEAIEKDVPTRVHANLPNSSDGAVLIANLPSDGIVEVACLVDGNGVQPTRFGTLPTQMAALCASHMGSYALGAAAAMRKSKDLAVQALMLDPLTAAVCSPSEIRSMTLELFESQHAYLSDYT